MVAPFINKKDRSPVSIRFYNRDQVRKVYHFFNLRIWSSTLGHFLFPYNVQHISSGIYEWVLCSVFDKKLSEPNISNLFSSHTREISLV